MAKTEGREEVAGIHLLLEMRATGPVDRAIHRAQLHLREIMAARVNMMA
jgi:hypothetical protein